MGALKALLRSSTTAVIATCCFASFSYAIDSGFPLNRSDLNVVTNRSFYGRDQKGDLINAVSEARGGRHVAELTASDSSLTKFEMSGSGRQLTYSRRSGRFLFSYVFVEQPAAEKFALTKISRRLMKPLFFDDDGGSFDVPAENESSNDASTSKCAASNSAQDQALDILEAVNSTDSCSRFAPKTAALAKRYQHRDEASPIRCIGRFESYIETANKIRGTMTVNDGTKLRCDASAQSKFDVQNSEITFGKEILIGNSEKRDIAFLHELLHSAGIVEESEVQALTRCCTFPTAKSSSCQLAELYDLAKARLTSSAVLLDYLRSPNISEMDKLRNGRALADSEDILRSQKDCSTSTRFENAARTILATSQAICSNIASSACSDDRQELKKAIQSKLEFHSKACTPNSVTRLANAAADQGKAPAEPDADPAAPASPALPQALQYSADTTEPGAARREIERIRQPLAAARQYGGAVARTIMAGMGSTAYAAQSSLPRRISEDEWSSRIKSVNPQTGQVTLDLGLDSNGREITASASIPFSGDTFQPPNVTIHSQAPSEKSSTSEPHMETAVSSIPHRIPRRGQASAGRAPPEKGEPARVKAESVTANRSGSASIASSGHRALSSRAVIDSSVVTASTLKRMLVRSQQPEVIIQKHIDDLKTNSMQVRFHCVWYPQNFKGTQLFDLDAYQGRSCGSR